jgi:hypothetical protein
LSTIDTTAQLTLLELANRLDPKGELAKIAEILNRNNPILKDAPFLEANNLFGHKHTRRLSLPSGTWRNLNAGVAKSASRTIPVIDVVGMLEARSEVDAALIDTAPNPKAARMSEVAPFIEGLSQDMASAIFYSNHSADPEKPHGLAPRLNLTSLSNVTGGGGTGSDTTSVYVVQWGEDRVHMIYPRGSKSLGVEHLDMGKGYADDPADSTKKFVAYMDHFMWYTGLVVRDERCIARYANIETSGATSTFDEDNLIALINEMPNEGAGGVIYCSSTIRTQMDIIAKDKSSPNVWISNMGGVSQTMFKQLPIKVCDAIVDTETAIS